MKSFILWDHDGVLVETEFWYYEATRRILGELGVPLDKDVYLRDMALGIPAWEQARAQGVSDADIHRARARRDRLYQHYLRQQDIEIPGVTDVLERLAADYAMAIVTTARRDDFELIHEQRRIVGFMEFVLTNGDYPRAKPAPDPYLEALRRFGASAEQAVVVEDSERGLRAAVAAGIDCVVVENDFVTGQDFSTATHCIGSLRELPALLARL